MRTYWAERRADVEEAEGVRVAVNPPDDRERFAPTNSSPRRVARDSDHVIDVGRDERRIERECMCRDSGIDFLNPRARAFQSRLDAAEDVADGIGPLGSWDVQDVGHRLRGSFERRA